MLQNCCDLFSNYAMLFYIKFLVAIYLFVVASVTVLAWNEKHKKLTSGDANGLIIVWVIVKGNLTADSISARRLEVDCK